MNYQYIENELNALLAQHPDVLVADHQQKFKSLITAEYPPILFGAGRLGKTVLAGLRDAGIEPIAFVDNNPGLWGTKFEGVDVLPLADARQRFSRNIFVISIYTANPVRKQLRQEGIEEISFPELAWLFPEQFLPYQAVEFPHKIFGHVTDVMRASKLWADETSRQEYLGQIKWRLTLEDSVLPPYLPQKEIYFPDIILPFKAEFFIDCGAFDGDTIREFIKRQPAFGAIVAIEPDQTNFLALQDFFKSLPPEQSERMSGFNIAASTTHGKVQFSETGSVVSSTGAGSHTVECMPLDELLDQRKPTYIKMDIEGAELDAIKGAQRTIQAHTPVLAICLYHKQEHLWELPLLLQSFSDQYKFFLRRYSDHCWESVCYAVPRERLK